MNKLKLKHRKRWRCNSCQIKSVQQKRRKKETRKLIMKRNLRMQKFPENLSKTSSINSQGKCQVRESLHQRT